MAASDAAGGDRAKELAADALDAIAAAIAREDDEGRFPRAALDFLAIAVRARPHLMSPSRQPAPPRKPDPVSFGDPISILLDELERPQGGTAADDLPPGR